MVKTKNAVYSIIDKNKEDIIRHFETNAGVTKVLGRNKKELGTVQQRLFEGIDINGVAFDTIKVSGLYKIQNVSGLPSGVSLYKTCILLVEAVGEIENPTMVKYTLTTQDGDIQTCVVSSGVKSPWTSGGKSAVDNMKSILSNVGSNDNLKTTAKSTLVNAINELFNTSTEQKRSISDINVDITKIKKNLTEHDHDDRYMKRTGSTMDGDLVVGKGQSINITNNSGRVLSIAKSSNGTIHLGSREEKLDLLSSNGEITINGEDLFHSGNHGAGSGLDADKLGGTSYRNFLRSDIGGEIRNSISLTGGSELAMVDGSGNSEIAWRGSTNLKRGTIKFDSNGNFIIKGDPNSETVISSRGDIRTYGKVMSNAANNEGGFVVKLSSSDSGMGMYRSSSFKDLGFYNWNKQKLLGYFGYDDNALHLLEGLVLQGSRIWVQPNAPSGSHKNGDIWIG